MTCPWCQAAELGEGFHKCGAIWRDASGRVADQVGARARRRDLEARLQRRRQELARSNRIVDLTEGEELWAPRPEFPPNRVIREGDQPDGQRDGTLSAVLIFLFLLALAAGAYGLAAGAF